MSDGGKAFCTLLHLTKCGVGCCPTLRRRLCTALKMLSTTKQGAVHGLAKCATDELLSVGQHRTAPHVRCVLRCGKVHPYPKGGCKAPLGKVYRLSVGQQRTHSVGVWGDACCPTLTIAVRHLAFA